MTTVAEVVRAAWPGADDETIDFVLWNRTAYPFECSARRIYRAARTACRAAAKSIRLCDFCRERAAPGHWVCAKCATVLKAEQLAPS